LIFLRGQTQSARKTPGHRNYLRGLHVRIACRGRAV